MCDDCGQRVRALAAPLCERCGAPTALSVGTCRACARLRWFTTARSALWLEGPVLDVVARWKRGEISPARLAGAFVAHELPRPRVEAIAVVPAVRDRRLERGADPPAELAAELGGWWDLPVVPLVRRTRGVRPQRGLDAVARRRNVRDAFAARAGPSLGGARRRRLHDRRHGRRVRPGAAASGRRAGPRDHARAHAPRSVLCESAAPWQTPGYDVPERGGT